MKAVILGIDPGIANTGYAVVEGNKSDFGNSFNILKTGVYTTRSKEDVAKRLAYIDNIVCNEILMSDEASTFDAVAIESVYFSRNASSAISTAYVIGILLCTAAQYHFPTMLFTPQRVKMAIGLKGNAPKKEVIQAVNRLFHKHITNNHTADAVCIAIAGCLEIFKENEGV